MSLCEGCPGGRTIHRDISCGGGGGGRTPPPFCWNIPRIRGTKKRGNVCNNTHWTKKKKNNGDDDEQFYEFTAMKAKYDL